MNRLSVKSSNIRSVGYDPATSTLEVEFSSGGVYRYPQVPAEIHAAMIKAESVGKFFHACVRDKFPAFKVDPMTATGASHD